MPDDVQLSGAPLSGKFQIECVDSGGYSSLSWEMDYDLHVWNVENQLSRSCHGLIDKVEVWEDGSFAYPANGRGFWIRYYGKREDVGQAKIVSSEDTPLEGEFIEYYQNTTHQYSNNLLYEPIPFDMLRAYEEMPQFEVIVNGTQAVCHSLNCGFEYIDPVGEVTGFTYDDDTGVLTVEGTSLPTTSDDLRYIHFAKTLCTLDLTDPDNSPFSDDGTSITCTLEHEATCGLHVPYVTAAKGLLPNSDDLADHSIYCTVDSVIPTSELNLLAIDNLTISGTMFPWDVSTSDITITFSDSASTECLP
jgi:hypothetical protein